jgi:probable phosphoglycerate mutase
VHASHILLIRHAESEWNAAGLWQGRGDPPLTRQGRGQANRLAEALAREGLAADVLITSDLRRAFETAHAVSDVLGCAPLADPRLQELDVGSWEGRTRDQIAARDGEALERFVRGEPFAPAGGGESREDVARRVHAAVADLLLVHRGRRLALVAHMGVLLSLLPDRAPLPNAGWCHVPIDALDLSRARQTVAR